MLLGASLEADAVPNNASGRGVSSRVPWRDSHNHQPLRPARHPAAPLSGGRRPTSGKLLPSPGPGRIAPPDPLSCSRSAYYSRTAAAPPVTVADNNICPATAGPLTLSKAESRRGLGLGGVNLKKRAGVCLPTFHQPTTAGRHCPHAIVRKPACAGETKPAQPADSPKSWACSDI